MVDNRNIFEKYDRAIQSLYEVKHIGDKNAFDNKGKKNSQEHAETVRGKKGKKRIPRFTKQGYPPSGG